MESLMEPEVRSILEAQGIKDLYPPQLEALPPVMAGENVVLAIPTASGKSLVAYLGILNKERRRDGRGKALYIVPLRALATEKYRDLRAFSSLGLKVGVASGDLDAQDAHLASKDVIVATSEKADSLLRHGVAWMRDVDIVVADEIHLMNDGRRGPTLEVLLTRLRQLRGDLQIIALSATVANGADLARWLDARLIESEWRPTKLKRGVLADSTIAFEDGSLRKLTVDEDDPVTALVMDILAEGGQALVFVNTRRSTQAVARRLAERVRTTLDGSQNAALAKMGESVAAGAEPTRLGATLAATIKGGCAFHHAGLTGPHRRLIEDAFRAGSLRALVATPTLAAGVNTPARRVVIRDVWRYEANMGNQPVPVLEIMQMMGRAGRPGYDPYGEAVLVAKSVEDQEILKRTYLEQGPEPIRSKLGAEPALRMHTLSTVAAGFATDEQGVHDFLDRTFYAHEGEGWLIKEQARTVLSFLVDNGFLERFHDRLEATPFGKRTSDLYVDPLSALTLKKAIGRAAQRDDVPTFSFLHAIASTVDIMSLYLRARDDWVWQRAAEVDESLLLRPEEAPTDEDHGSFIKTASLLHDWIEEKRMDDMEKIYGVGPGDVRDKVDRAQWLAHAMRELARVLEYKPPRALADLPLRLKAGAKRELLPLIRLEGIGRVRARRLFAAGYTDRAKLQAAELKSLAAIPTIGPRVARQILKQVGGRLDAKPERIETGLDAF